VALGVGAAVTVGSGVAWADDSSASSGTSSKGSSKHSRPAHPSRSHAVTDKANAGSASAGSSTDGDTKPVAAKSNTNKSVKHKDRSNAHGQAKSSAKASTTVKNADTSHGAAAVTLHTDDKATATKPAVTSAAATSVAVTAVSTAVSTAAVAQVTATQVTATTPTAATSALSAVSKALLGIGTGTTPAISPAMWVMAAAARRELGQSADAGTAVVSGATAAAATAAAPAAGSTAANHAPVISASVGTPSKTTGVVTGTIKVTDSDKDSVTVTVDETSAKGGSVSYDSATGKYTYTPSVTAQHAAAITGATKSDKTDTFTITADDGKDGVVTKQMTVTVLAANKAPTRGTATVNSPDDSGVVTGTLNATDPDGDALTYTAANTKKGTVTVDTDGTFSYTPTAAAMHAASATNAKASALSDTFTVKIADGHGGTTTETVTVSIAGTNATPTVTTDATAGNPSSKGTVTGTIKVTDADKDSLKYTATADEGKVTITSKGTFTYTPTAAARHAASADGATEADTTDTVTISVSDGHGGTVTQSVTVNILPKNTAASVRSSAGKADATTGIIVGTIKATDADKDTVSYAATTTSAKDGTVTIDAATGQFTYTPTDAVRYAAGAKGASSAVKTDSFTVTVDDGHGGITAKTVTVNVSPLKATVQGSVSTTGTVTVGGVSYDATFNRDGSRAIITTTDADGGSPTYTVIDTASGAKVGSTVAVSGSPWTVAFSSDGTRAVVYTDDQDDAGNATTNVAVINATSGVQLGSTLTLTGTIDSTMPFSSDGSRAVVVAFSTDTSAPPVAQFAVLNLQTGEQVGSTASFAGTTASSSVTVQLNAQGNRAVVTVAETASTAIRIIDTGTGSQLGATATFDGVSYNGAQLSADGNRALIAVANFVADGDTVTVNNTTAAIFDLASGAMTTYDQDGTGSAQLSADGSRLVINTTTGGNVADYVGWVGTYETATGTQVGSLVQVAGMTYMSPQFTADQTRAVVTTYQLVSDGTYNYLTSVGVVVIDAATGEQVGNTVNVAGAPVIDGDYPAVVQLNSDGSRAVITAMSDSTTQFGVVNTVTGQQVGKTLSVTGTVQVDGVDMLPVFTDDGGTAVITAFSGSDAKGYSTRVAILNLATGLQVGKTLKLTGGVDTADANAYPVVQLGSSDSRVLITTFSGDDDSGYASRVALISTVTGVQLGSTHTYKADWPAWTQFTDDGQRVVVETDSGWDTTKARSTLTFFDTYTGSQLGATTTYPANAYTWGTFTGDGGRVAMTTISGDETGGYTTYITVVDPITGAQIGEMLPVFGDGYNAVFGADSSHLLVTTVSGSDSLGYTTTISLVAIT